MERSIRVEDLFGAEASERGRVYGMPTEYREGERRNAISSASILGEWVGYNTELYEVD